MQAWSKELFMASKDCHRSLCSSVIIRSSRKLSEIIVKNDKAVFKENKGKPYPKREIRIRFISEINAKVLIFFYNISKL